MFPTYPVLHLMLSMFLESLTIMSVRMNSLDNSSETAPLPGPDVIKQLDDNKLLMVRLTKEIEDLKSSTTRSFDNLREQVHNNHNHCTEEIDSLRKDIDIEITKKLKDNVVDILRESLSTTVIDIEQRVSEQMKKVWEEIEYNNNDYRPRNIPRQQQQSPLSSPILDF
jgi:neutral trehalase